MQTLEDVDSYFDITFFYITQISNPNLEDADSYSQISFLKFQT